MGSSESKQRRADFRKSVKTDTKLWELIDQSVTFHRVRRLHPKIWIGLTPNADQSFWPKFIEEFGLGSIIHQNLIIQMKYLIDLTQLLNYKIKSTHSLNIFCNQIAIGTPLLSLLLLLFLGAHILFHNQYQIR